MNNFKVGDIVYQKSDRKTEMVIIDNDLGDNKVMCRWMDCTTVKTGKFSPDELEKKDAPGAKTKIFGV